jgi:DNA replicative helicase MCM subunit Mcm2 (Cdc46/Mcm family)
VANDETRRNVTGLMKEAICSSVRVGDDTLVIGILEYLQSDKKIKTLTDTAELIEDAVHAATVEQSSEMLNSILKWNHNNKIKKLTNKNKVIKEETIYIFYKNSGKILEQD